ncbi:type IV pilus assembly protein FimV, partial [Azoarcus taiwanensis]
MKTTLKATLVATAIATLPLSSFAAGLGGLNVLSGLGQPLRAEIEVQATPEELRTLSARVAPPDAFVRANVGYSPIMSALNFSIETRGNRSVVRVTSDRPIDEPFLEMLVELNWSEGRLLRQYTFLLDPVELARPPVAAATIDRPSAAPAVAPRPAPTPRPAAAAAGSQYQVARGDTLHGIATRNRPANTTVEQMMIALLRQNPAAFVDGNINRLRAGAILTIPESSAVQGITANDARREVVAQTTDFEAYRRGLATAVAERPAAPAPTDAREQVGEIVPRVAEPQAADLPRDRVEVSGAAQEGVDGDRAARLQALEEELVARERSLEEAYDRLSELEQSIRDLQGLIELRNTALAQMQEQLAAAGVTEPAAPPIAAEPESEAPPAAVESELEAPALAEADVGDVPLDAAELDVADLPDLDALLADADVA